MDLIDRTAHSNALRCVDPAQKGALALLALLLCLLLDRPAASLLAACWMLALAALWARVPAQVLGRVMLVQGFFVTLASLGVALRAGVGAPAPGLWAVRAGPLWLATGPAALAAALGPAARALGCAAALSFLILSTPLVDLVELLRRMRAPATLLDLITLTYRAIFVLQDSLHTTTAAPSAESSAARLLRDAYNRSLRLESGLEGRIAHGAPPAYTRDRRAWLLGAALAAGMLLAGAAL
jgi:cobalt/nickel transport system permease protein